MLTFRTEVVPEPSPVRISHETKMLFSGSCFASIIGSFLKDMLFPVKVNPFGVVYNPLSVVNTLGILLDGGKYTKEDLEFRNELWFSWDHHSSFSHPDYHECLNRINTEIETSSRQLKESRFLFITFGTAWIYKLKDKGKVVSNCHKIPASEFDRILLEPDELISIWTNFLNELLTIKPDLRVIFTVSPVRHWKEGAHGNQLSKSALLLAIDKLIKAFPQNTGYFPAYEIMLDDLRDYRFYAEDLLHPNSQASEYIRDKFSQTYFDEKTIGIIKEILKLVRAKGHRMIHEHSAASGKFKSAQLQTINHLSGLYPHIDFEGMKEYFS